MNIKQFRYGIESNLGYLLWSDSEAVAIDGGAAEEIIRFCDSKGLTIKYVTNTHEHGDHTPGNEKLLKQSHSQHITPAQMCSIKILGLGSEQLEAFPAPGHSDDSIVFFFKDESEGCLITGDTLFNGTVGNCYTKNYELYFDSLQKILRFPPGTRIYAGHDIFDYTTGVMKTIDPDNPNLPDYIAGYSENLLVTSLGQELAVNPFIRFDDPALDDYRSGLGMPLETSYQRFRAMMRVH
jgi:hydroxyacylglutathione hydrolase